MERESYDWRIPLGSADTLELTWTNEDGSPIDLTGWTPSLFDASPAIAGSVRVVIPGATAALGRILVHLDALPSLRERIPQSFRVALQPPPPATALDRQALPELRVVPV